MLFPYHSGRLHMKFLCLLRRNTAIPRRYTGRVTIGRFAALMVVVLGRGTGGRPVLTPGRPRSRSEWGSSAWTRRTSSRSRRCSTARSAEGDLAGIRVVAAYPGGSPDVASSRDRVEGYTTPAPRRVRGRDRRLDRRPARQGRRRPAGERRRPPAPRAGRARPEGAQAGLHRQAGRRLAGRRGPDLRARREVRDALLLQLLAPLQPVDPGLEDRPEGRATSSAATPTARARWRSTTPTSSGTGSTGSSRCSP